MEITEVRIKLMEDYSEKEKLQAFCSITIDHEFVIRDLKIIEGPRGCFIAMPSRKLMDRCKHCQSKNQLRARYCNQCGSRLNENRAFQESKGKIKLHADIAHPIHQANRDKLQQAILSAFLLEKEKAKQPGYVCSYEDLDGEFERLNYVQMAAEKHPGYRLETPAIERTA